MAMIAKVLTQDGPAAAGATIDGAGADAGAEFLALLSGAAVRPPSPAVAAPRDAEPQVAPGADSAVAASLAALAAAGVFEPAPASATPVTQEPTHAADMKASLPPAPPHGLPEHAALHARAGLPGLPGAPEPVAPTDPQPPLATHDARHVPAATLPPTASPVAVAVLQALQSGQRPVPQVMAPHALVPPPGPAPGAEPAAVTEVVSQLAAAIDEMASGDLDSQAEQDGDRPPGGLPTATTASGTIGREALAGAVYQRSVPGTIGTPAWRHALGAELRVMLENGVGAATLRLSPEHLGPVEVRIDLTDDRANVWFSASHADTRAALADALPRLRDMLASVGVDLGETGVQRDLPGGSGQQEASSRGAAASVPEAAAESRVVVTRLDAGRGMVDEYA